MSAPNNKQPTMEQMQMARKLGNKKPYPRLGPQKRATHCIFYLAYGILCVSWSSGFYDYAIRSETMDIIVRTVSCVLFIWGIWDFRTMDDNGE
jgi:hypothetical protein